jgi:BirA family biotin operon repressor/biotin-[acetyl-CoA-carboxylase] ligase
MSMGLDMFSKETISAVFKGDIIGREVIFYEVTTSTNDKVMEIGQRGVEGTVVVADAQTHGRGRFGRDWVSPPNVNLYFTVLLKPPFAPKDAPFITLMAAVAVVSAIREYTGLDAVIKWPNDILIRDKKVGGILTEMKSSMDRIDLITLGVGVNVNMALNMLPKDIKPLTTSLKEEKGEYVNRVELLKAIFAKLEYWYKSLLEGRRKVLLDEWLRLDSTIGKEVNVKTRDGTTRFQERIMSGIAEGISDEGELIVRLFSGTVEKVCAGDVTIVKR